MLCKLFGCRWKTTRHNGYMVEVEQKCIRCNSYRHHKFEDIDSIIPKSIDWQQGKYPNR